MKVIDFNEEEQLIKKDIERARANMKDVEDLSDFGSTKEKKTPEKKPSESKKKKNSDEEEEPLTSKAIIKDPNRPDIRIRKARVQIKNNSHQEALQTIDELILSNPDVFEGYHLKFLVLESLNKFDEAEAVIDEALSLFKKDVNFA